MSLIRGTSVVAGLTTVSRALGFFRDLLIASVFGASFLTDIFFVAFRIPNLLRSFVAEGALTSAFVPVFSHALAEDRLAATRIFRAMLGTLLVITVVLALLGILFARQFVLIIAPGFTSSPDQIALCTKLTQIMLPYLVCISCVALINGALNSLKVFGAAPLAQIVMNICLVVGALLAIPAHEVTGLYILSASVLFGGVLQVVVQIPTLKKNNLPLSPQVPFLIPETKQILRLMLPAILGAAAYQISVIGTTLLASLLPAGSVSWLFYADRLSQLPIGIFSVALGSVLLPSLSHAIAKKDAQAFNRELMNALRYSSFVFIPFSGFLFFFAEPLTSVFFERGQFNSVDSWQTARALQASCIGLWAIACNYLCMRGFLAAKNTRTPAIIGSLQVIVALSISLICMGPIQHTESVVVSLIAYFQELIVPFFPSIDFRHAGLALSTGLANMLTLPLLLILLSKQQGQTLRIRAFVTSSTKIAVATGFTLLACSFLPDFFHVTILSLLCNSLISLAIFIALAKILQITEMQETFALIRRKIH